MYWRPCGCSQWGVSRQLVELISRHVLLIQQSGAEDKDWSILERKYFLKETFIDQNNLLGIDRYGRELVWILKSLIIESVQYLGFQSSKHHTKTNTN